MKKLAGVLLVIVLCLSCMTVFSGCGAYFLDPDRDEKKIEVQNEKVQNEKVQKEERKIPVWKENALESDWPQYTQRQLDKAHIQAKAKYSKNWFQKGYGDAKGMTEEQKQIVIEAMEVVRKDFQEGETEYVGGTVRICRPMSLKMLSLEKAPPNYPGYGYYDPLTDKMIIYVFDNGKNLDRENKKAAIIHELVHYQTRDFIVKCNSDFWVEVFTSLWTSRLSPKSTPSHQRYVQLFEAIKAGAPTVERTICDIMCNLYNAFLRNNAPAMAVYVNGMFRSNVFDKIRGTNILADAQFLQREAPKKSSVRTFWLEGLVYVLKETGYQPDDKIGSRSTLRPRVKHINTDPDGTFYPPLKLEDQ